MRRAAEHGVFTILAIDQPFVTALDVIFGFLDADDEPDILEALDLLGP